MGLQIDYFYSLTPRQFGNTIKGFRIRDEIKSKETWILARRIAFLVLTPNLKEHAKELDLMVFPWEEKTVKILAEKELLEMEEQIRISEAFFARADESRRLKKLNT